VDQRARAPGDVGVIGRLSTRTMSAAIWSISASCMPRLVTAGVPMRMPLAVIGGF
jgi:hypothetical protein